MDQRRRERVRAGAVTPGERRNEHGPHGLGLHAQLRDLDLRRSDRFSGVIMRVANVGRGTLENGAITLDLIQDYFYVHRGIVHALPGGHSVLTEH